MLVKQRTHAQRAHKYESPLVTLQSCHVYLCLVAIGLTAVRGGEDYVCALTPL